MLTSGQAWWWDLRLFGRVLISLSVHFPEADGAVLSSPKKTNTLNLEPGFSFQRGARQTRVSEVQKVERLKGQLLSVPLCRVSGTRSSPP